jgi:hypothetical protein
MEAHRITDPQDARTFVRAGNAYLTLRSAKTGTRYTYRVRRKKEDDRAPLFVSVLYGPNNETDYQYIGSVFDGFTFRTTAASRLPSDATPVKAFGYFARALQHDQIPDNLEVWHEGRCGRCGRTLTVPESIKTGLGPECAKRPPRG